MYNLDWENTARLEKQHPVYEEIYNHLGEMAIKSMENPISAKKDPWLVDAVTAQPGWVPLLAISSLPRSILR
jgi:hypothetical protein